jgi:hypothetical protein
VLLCNADAWTAFAMVHRCRVRDFGTPCYPDWANIRTRLGVARLWREEVVEALEHCFAELERLEHDEADQRKQLEDAAAKARDAAKGG